MFLEALLKDHVEEYQSGLNCNKETYQQKVFHHVTNYVRRRSFTSSPFGCSHIQVRLIAAVFLNIFLFVLISFFLFRDQAKLLNPKAKDIRIGTLLKETMGKAAVKKMPK